MHTATTLRDTQSEFDTLFQNSRRRITNLARRLLGNPEDAEDVAQDAYIRAWRKFDTFDRTRSFDAWLTRIVINRVIDFQRTRRASIASLDATVTAPDQGAQTLAEVLPAPHSDPAEAIMNAAMNEQILEGLRRLPAAYRTAVLLCDVEEHSYEEIATITQCSIGTVRSRIHRGRVLLRQHVGAEPRHRRAAEHGAAL